MGRQGTIRWSDPKVTSKDLRSFGIAVGGIFLLIGAWPLVTGVSVRTVPVLIALLLVVPSLLSPRLLSVPYRLWMKIGGVLGWINSRIIMALLFFLVVTPLGLFRRLFRVDTIGRHFDDDCDTYGVASQARPAERFKNRY